MEYEISNNFKDLELSDKVVAYSCGFMWKIIKLDTMKNRIILHDKYVNNTDSIDITLVLCPISLYSCTFTGILKYIEHRNDIMILEDKDEQFEIIDDSRNKYEVFIGNLSSIILLFPDAKSINIKNNINLNIKIPVSEPNSKTLVYLIAYKSKHQKDKIKKYIIIGNDVNKNSESGYDLRKSKLIEYLISVRDKITERNGYIVPILLDYAKIYFPSSKYINLF
jgi:hypothetical protein